jgi:hypothetical protein
MKAYCIALQENSLSWRLGNECVSAALSFGVKAKIFRGIVGFYANPEDFGIKNLLNLKIQERIGALGCFLSHFLLWKRCVGLGSPIMILEHDGLMIRELPKNLLEQPFDVCYLDPFNQFSKEYEPQIKKSLRRPVTFTKAEEDHNYGLYGYIIKPTGAQKAIDLALTCGAYSAEVHINTESKLRRLVTSETIVKLHHHYTSGRMIEDSLTINLRTDDAI